ncbi:MAG: hypothetical protein AAB225_03555 [Acidobacteriota bacterium]
MPNGDRKGTPAPGKAGQWERCLIALILAGLLIALVVQARRVGITVDEPNHLLSSYLYRRGAEPLKPSDMPPLVKIVGGWVPRLLGLPEIYRYFHAGGFRESEPIARIADSIYVYKVGL